MKFPLRRNQYQVRRGPFLLKFTFLSRIPGLVEEVQDQITLGHIQMKFILLSGDPSLVEKHFGPLDFSLTEYDCTDFTIKQQVTLRILMLAIVYASNSEFIASKYNFEKSNMTVQHF